jgi:drug/metabolite transporter (DMT)-like permease
LPPSTDRWISIALAVADRWRVSTTRGPVALLAAAAGFGSASVSVKLAYASGARPETLLGARLGLASVLLTAAAALPRRAVSLGPRELALAAGAGAAFAGAGLLEFEALGSAPAAAVVVLVFVAPVWVALGAWVRWRRPPGWRTAGLIAIVLAGTALLVATPSSHAVHPTAAALALGASVLSAAFFLALSRLLIELQPRQAACLIAAPAAACALLAPGTPLTELATAPTAWLAVAIGALTAGSLLLLCVGLACTPAVPGAAIASAEPVAAALLAWLVLGEALAALQLLGALIVIAAVLELACLPSAAPLVEPNCQHEDRAHNDVLPEPLDPGDQQPVRQNHGDQDADDGARDRAHAAGKARATDDHGRQRRDQLGGVTGRDARHREAR